MSAPAALAMAKLFWPETKKSKANADDVYNMSKGYVRCTCTQVTRLYTCSYLVHLQLFSTLAVI